MKLIFIYGPPGVGKLTVARALAKITGYKLFHNHLIADLVSSIFPFGTKAYSDWAGRIRLILIEAALNTKVKGMVFTFAYGGETYHGLKDDQFVKKIIGAVERHGGQVNFVKLSCNREELKRRVKYPERKLFAKIHKVRILQSVMRKLVLDALIPFRKSLIIDNTKLSPKKVAGMIKVYYKL